MSKKDNLFLVEDFVHVDDLLRRNMRDNGEWIALGPGAMYALERKGIPYKIPEDFCSNEELEQLCRDSHEKCESFCDYIDHILFKKYPDLKKWRVHPFLFYMDSITKFVDTIGTRILQLNKILHVYPKHKVWIHKTPHYPWREFDLWFSNKEKLWGDILSLKGWNCQIEFLKVSWSGYHLSFWRNKDVLFVKFFFDIIRTVKKTMLKSFVLYNVASYLKLTGIKGLIRGIRKKPMGILFYGYLCEWKWLIQLLINKNRQIIFTGPEKFKVNTSGKKGKEEKGNESLITKDAYIMSLFTVDGILFFPLLKERLTWIFENSFIQCQNIISLCKKIIRRYNVQAVFTANTATFTDHVVKQAFRYFHIPVIHWQHGFMFAQNGRINQLNEFNDMMTSDVLFTYGEASTRAHKLYINRFPVKVISMGSPSLDTIYEESRKRKEIFRKRLLYVTTGYYQNYWYYGFSPPFSDRYLLRDQLSIMAYLKNIVKEEDVKVTVKLWPGMLLSKQFKSDFASLFRVVEYRPKFAGLFSANHIIVIDSPTTTALQAVATRKPVFILLRHIQYPEYSRKLLERRAVCADTVGELINKIQQYIEHGMYPADVNDDEYLRTHGNHLNDGNSAQRALKKVFKIIGTSTAVV